MSATLPPRALPRLQEKNCVATHLLQSLPIKVQPQPPHHHLRRLPRPSASDIRPRPLPSVVFMRRRRFWAPEVLKDLGSDVLVALEVLVEREELSLAVEDVVHAFADGRPVRKRERGWKVSGERCVERRRQGTEEERGRTMSHRKRPRDARVVGWEEGVGMKTEDEMQQC